MHQNHDFLPVTPKLVKWRIILSLKLTLISADLKGPGLIAMVRNNRPRLWTTKSLTGTAMSNPTYCTANTGQSLQTPTWKKKGYLELVTTLACIIRVKRSICLLSCLLLNSFDSHLWALRLLHTVRQEYPLWREQFQHPPLHTAELLHDKESKKTALSTAPPQRLKVLIYLPSWHSCSLTGCFKQTRRNIITS